MKNDSQHRNNNYRRELRKQAVLYAKLFLVFGITWSLEPLSIVLTSYNVYNIYAQVFTQSTSVLNLLRGVFMFLIFVSPAKVKTQIKQWKGVRKGGVERKMTMNTSMMNTTMNTSMMNTTVNMMAMNTTTSVGVSEFHSPEAQPLMNKEKI